MRAGDAREKPMLKDMAIAAVNVIEKCIMGDSGGGGGDVLQRSSCALMS